MTTVRHRLTGSIDVALPPAQAFRLFTPRGEQDWVDGWAPHFPDEVDDDTKPGTVFETDAHGEHTVWVVLDSEPGRAISYARTTVGSRAGTVSVSLREAPGGSSVTVSYDLTALSESGRAELDAFAAGYPDFLKSWHDTIRAKITGPQPGNPNIAA